MRFFGAAILNFLRRPFWIFFFFISVKNLAHLYEVSFFSALWMVFPESWKRRAADFYAHHCIKGSECHHMKLWVLKYISYQFGYLQLNNWDHAKGPSIYYVSAFLDLFWPTHYVKINTALYWMSAKTAIFLTNQPTQSFCWHNIRMVPNPSQTFPPLCTN